MPAPGAQHRATSVTANPFEEPENHIRLYTAEQIATLQARLDKFLGPEYISSRDGPGGKKVHYIAAVQCIQLANEVFGFNGWSSSIREVQVDYVEEIANTGKFNMAVSVIMRVTLRDGTFHEDIGYGQIENCKSKAMGFEKTKKEATTDALKRTLRNFGNVLGNCIYDKDYVGKVTKIRTKPRKFDVADLHRHADYAPVKEEPSAPVVAEPTPLTRAPSINAMSISAVDDEFDAADFDDVDFSVADDGHPDEVVVEEPVVSNHFGASNQQTNGRIPARQPTNPNNHSMAVQPQHRAAATRNGTGPAPSNLPPSNRPPMNNNHSQNQQVPALAAPRPPYTTNNGSSRNSSPTRQAASAQTPQPRSHVAQQANTSRLNFTDISEVPSNKPPNHQQITAEEPHVAAIVPPPDAAPLFLSARAAAGLPASSTVFNPHAESPSIRKTAGVDHTKSMRLKKDLAPDKSDPSSATVPASLASHQMDGVRRIGMPPNMPSPMSNRSSYKPPSKRPLDGGGPGSGPRAPLTDVTANAGNTSLAQSYPDIKRQRIDEEAPVKPISQKE